MEGPRSSLPITAVHGFLDLGYGGGDIMSAEVPHFHPGVLLDQGGFGFGLSNVAVGGGAATAADLGAHYVANNNVLASFASQLLANSPTPPRDDHASGRTPSNEMDDELYGIAGCDSHVAASLRCPSQSRAMAVWSSSKKSYDICTSAGGSVTVSAHDTYHLAGAGLSDAGGLHYPLAACSGDNASAAAARELSLTLCSNSIASSNSTLNATELRLEEAKTLAEKLCDGPLSSAANLWILRASMEINSLATASGSSPLNKENLSSLFDLFGTCRHRLLALPRPSLKFMQYCIELEASLASLGDHGALTNARRLYDSVVDMYPQEREVWRSYYSLELKMGTSESVNAVYARARKVLGDSTVHAYPGA